MACRLDGAKPFLNQCQNIVYLTLRNKLQWNFSRNSNIFFQKNALENAVCIIASISSRPQWVKSALVETGVNPIGHVEVIWPMMIQFTDANWDYLGREVQSSAVIMRSKIVRFCINNCRNWDIISIGCWIHKRHPISHPSGRAIGCLLWIFVIKLTAL